jgi:hypothetical protein
VASRQLFDYATQGAFSTNIDPLTRHNAEVFVYSTWYWDCCYWLYQILIHGLIIDMWISKVHVNIKVTVTGIIFVNVINTILWLWWSSNTCNNRDALTTPNVDLFVKSTWNKKYQTISYTSNWHVIWKLWQQISMVSSIQLVHDIIVFVIMFHFRFLDFLKLSGFPA